MVYVTRILAIQDILSVKIRYVDYRLLLQDLTNRTNTHTRVHARTGTLMDTLLGVLQRHLAVHCRA